MYLLRRNFNKLSNVCVRPETAVPTAENAVWMTPSKILKIDWKTATMEPRTAVKAWKMEETKFPRDSTREGILVCVRLGIVRWRSLQMEGGR
jgi:hypothetical protein